MKTTLQDALHTAHSTDANLEAYSIFMSEYDLSCVIHLFWLDASRLNAQGCASRFALDIYTWPTYILTNKDHPPSTSQERSSVLLETPDPRRAGESAKRLITPLGTSVLFSVLYRTAALSFLHFWRTQGLLREYLTSI